MRRKRKKKKSEGGIKTKRYEYAFYRGDTFIDVGTLDEIAKRQRVRVKTLQYYASRAARKRYKYYETTPFVVKIGKVKAYNAINLTDFATTLTF